MSGSKVQHPEGQEAREGRAAGKAKAKAGSSRDMLVALEQRLTQMEEATADAKDRLEDSLEELKDEVKERVDEEVESLTQRCEVLEARNEALEALIETVHARLAELEGKLATCEGAIGRAPLAATPKPPKVDVPKPREFSGARVAKKVDNFLWSVEQYFRAKRIEDDATRVNTAAMYLTDFALLWWRGRFEEARLGGQAIETWEAFQREFRQ